ncbi:antitoxin HicB [Candidatus Magnetomoraceae bacterium gMMP-15]
MNIKIILEKSEDGGYTAIVPSLPGCVSEGDSRQEAIQNIQEAIELYMEPVEDDLIFASGYEELELAI